MQGEAPGYNMDADDYFDNWEDGTIADPDSRSEHSVFHCKKCGALVREQHFDLHGSFHLGDL